MTTTTSSRPDWDWYLMGFAEMASLRGTCRVKVGAVVARDHRLLLTGYAGSLPGQPHCTDVGCDYYWRGEGMKLSQVNRTDSHGQMNWSATIEEPQVLRKHCQRTIHAERNILSIAAKEGIRLDGATWLTFPFAPCDDCARMLVIAGARRVIWTKPKPGFEHYADSQILRDAGIETTILEYGPQA